MKKLITILFISGIVFHNSIANAKTIIQNKNSLTIQSKSLTSDDIKVLTKRVHEIKLLVKSGCSVKQKSELRTELIEIKQKLTDPFTGIYLSAGAIIVILIVLIILIR